MAEEYTGQYRKNPDGSATIDGDHYAPLVVEDRNDTIRRPMWGLPGGSVLGWSILEVGVQENANTDVNQEEDSIRTDSFSEEDSRNTFDWGFSD